LDQQVNWPPSSVQPEPEKLFTRATLLAAMNDPAATGVSRVNQARITPWLEQIVNFLGQNTSESLN
jgi:hypothetical protein